MTNRDYGFGEAEMDGAAVLAGDVAGATDAARVGAALVFGGTAPTARSAGLTEGAGPVVAGVIFVTVPGGPTADDGAGLAPGVVVALAPGVADAPGMAETDAPGTGVAEAAGAGVIPFINSRRRSLWVLPLRA